MAKHRSILLVIACFSAVLLAAQASSFALRKVPPRRAGMTAEEHSKEIERAHDEAKQQRLKASEEGLKALDVRFLQARIGLLRISERQWRTIEPIIDKIQVLGGTAWAGAPGWGGREERDFHWYKHSEGTHLTRAKALHEMSDGERLADELVDLLRDENSKGEEIRTKITALQRVRENARKELVEVKRELAAIPMTPRQEAIFLIMGCID